MLLKHDTNSINQRVISHLIIGIVRPTIDFVFELHQITTV